MRVLLIVLVLGILGGGFEHLQSFADQVGRELETGDGAAKAAKAVRKGDCRLRKRVVVVRLDSSGYPATAAHIREAIAAGEKRVLHLDRRVAEANREASLAGIPTREGYDRDEWPMAATREGGEGAHVAYVPSADNRGAGAVIGQQLRPYCNGQAFRVKIAP